MKGLLIKNLMCMKKRIYVFAFLFVGVLIMAIMYVVSAKYGNIALAYQNALAEGGEDEFNIQALSEIVLLVVMILPIAELVDGTKLFASDSKAGFAKVAAGMPLSIGKRVSSFFATTLILLGIGIAADVFIAFVLSVVLADMALISFGDFILSIVVIACVMAMFNALNMLFCIFLGPGKEQKATETTITVITIGLILINIKKVIWFAKDLIITLSKGFNQAEGPEVEISTVFDIIGWIKDKAAVLLIVTLAISALSYVASIFIAKRKRGAV